MNMKSTTFPQVMNRIRTMTILQARAGGGGGGGTATIKTKKKDILKCHISTIGKRSGGNASASAATATAAAATEFSPLPVTFVFAGIAAGAWVTSNIYNDNVDNINVTHCSARRSATSGGLDVVTMGTPTKEASTGILFPQLCNGLTFVGCGVRVKYGFVKVYAVGTYMDPIAMSAVKKQGKSAIGSALLNPQYPRTIRIVMNRGLSIDKYTAAIVEALTPRMGGQDLDKLEEFKNLNPKVDLVEGAEMEMTVRGHTMLYKNSLGGVGQIDSEVFCKALCDVYYGKDAVSSGHKEMVIDGIAKM